MQNTDNFNLKIYEGEDLFNPLVVENVNAQTIDTQMKKNENHTVGDATELVSGTVHALTRLTPDTPMLRFTATSRFTAGDTFTVDGVQVSALTVSGEQLPDGAYIIGSEVLAYLKGTLLTFFTSQGTLATAQNALKLGGNKPEYYATAAAVQQAQETATAAGNLANDVSKDLANLSKIIVSQKINEQAIESSNSEFKELLKRTLTNNSNKAKTYLSFARLEFSRNENGDRMLRLSDTISCKACETYNTSLAYTKFIIVDANSSIDVIVQALQNSGSTISVQGFLQIIELT